VPLLLCGTALSRLLKAPLVEPYFLLPAAFLFTWMAVAKWRMPLHFDVGDKSYYVL
jgi:uncharacterized integral membrane protein